MSQPSNDEIRYKILQVLYETALNNKDWRVKRSYLLTKLDFNEKTIDFNLNYLHSRKLAEIVEISNTNWDKARITGEGIDVYEHKLKFIDKYPFIQVAVQNIDGAVYGNAVQAVDSQVSINQMITDSFKQAYSTVANQTLSEEQKMLIKSYLRELEEEIKTKNPDKSKVEKLWGWIKTNANWVVPTIKEIIEDIIKII